MRGRAEIEVVKTFNAAASKNHVLSQIVCLTREMKYLRLFLLVTCGFAQIFFSHHLRAEDVQLFNDFLKFTFDKSGALTGFIESRTGQNLLEARNAPTPLWQIDFSSSTNQFKISSDQAKAFRSERMGGTPSTLRMTWENFGPLAARDFKVTATVQLDASEPISRWSIAVENFVGLIPGAVRFPMVHGIKQPQGSALAVPVWLGQNAPDARELLVEPDGKGRRLEWNYPGQLSLQCLALHSSNAPGFYVSCDDTSALRKSFSFSGDGEGRANYEMLHFPENRMDGTTRYELSYKAILGTFRGDWLTAAERYRSWGTNQVWAKESRLQKNLVPSWAQETGMWVWNRGNSVNVLEPAVALQKELDLPVSVFWHWWHGCAYDIGFPEYLPPREGTEAFKSAMKRAHKNDVRAIVYMNQRLWGMTTKSWIDEGAERFAVKGEDGKVRPEVYNVFTKQACASMCMHTPFWRNKYASIAEEAIKSLDVDGIYMDQACSSLACFDARHGHSLGGGAYWMNGFRKLSTDIRERTAREKVALAGEGCGEAWLPHLDLMLALQVAKERYHNPTDGWEPIPFFSAVYHPYAILYGNYSSLTMPPYDELWPAEFAPEEPLKLLDQKFSQQFFLEQARSFVWGQQPTIANFMPSHLHERPNETAYMMRLAKIRNRAEKYLMHGTFLRAPRLNVPNATINLSRLSIYAGQRDGVTSLTREYPLAISGAWRANDGNIAIALASISNEPISVSFDPTELALPRNSTLYRIEENGRKKIGRFKKGSGSMVVELPAHGACILEFVR